MNIDFSIVLKDLDGNPIKKPNGGDDLTLRSACVEALMTTFPSEVIGGEERFKRYELAHRIHNHLKVEEIKVEEISMVKDLVGRAYSTGVVGPAYNALEQQKSS